MSKVAKNIFIIMCCICLVGCTKNGENEDKKNETLNKDIQQESETNINKMCNIPNIVFCYSSQYNYEKYEKYLIDRYGNIYFSNNEEIYRTSCEKALELYDENVIQNEMILVGKLEASEVENKYSLLMDIVNDGNYEITSSLKGIDAIVKEEKWIANFCDDDESVNSTELFYRGRMKYQNEDERVYDIVNWMDEVIENNK